MALKNDGMLWTFGGNGYGELGTAINLRTFRPNPTPTKVLSGVSAIAAGYYHSMALKSDGTLWTFGANDSGQLGTSANSGTFNPNPVPAQVMSDVMQPGGGGGVVDPCAGRRKGDTNCDGYVRVAVLGDSYISGEGSNPILSPVSGYLPGTSQPSPRNVCHRSMDSWAVKALPRDALSNYQLAEVIVPDGNRGTVSGAGRRMGQDAVLFAACSGAVTGDYYRANVDVASKPSEANRNQPAQRDQLRAFRGSGQNGEEVDIVYVSFGGNDAGFAKLVETCLFHNCIESPEKQVNVLSQAVNAAANVELTLKDIRADAPSAEIYIAAYPNPLLPNPTDSCGSIGGGAITFAERQWLSNVFIPKLNALRFEAVRAGLEFTTYRKPRRCMRTTGFAQEEVEQLS